MLAAITSRCQGRRAFCAAAPVAAVLLAALAVPAACLKDIAGGADGGTRPGGLYFGELVGSEIAYTRDELVLHLPVFAPPTPQEMRSMPPLPLAAAEGGGPLGAREATTAGAERPTYEGDSRHCGRLSDSLEEQLQAVLLRRREEGLESRPLAWTVIDASYAGWALDQQAQLANVASLPFTLFVSVDLNRSVAEELCRQGLPTIDFAVEFGRERGDTGETIEWTTKYRVAKAKFLMPTHLLYHDVANLFVEADVFWLKDPMPFFESALAAPAPQGAPAAAPSILMPTHHNNPFAVNIGLWYVPRGAHKELSRAFQLSWDLMARFYSSEHKENPYSLFDQCVLTDVFHFAFEFEQDPDLWNCTDHACSFRDSPERKPFCEELNRHKVTELAGRKLRNDLIQCSDRAVWDDYTIAVHVLSNTPLSNAAYKVSRAKLQGAWIGRPSYYENVPRPTSARLLAWDGDYQSATLDQLYCKYPLYDTPPCGAAVTLPIMAALGQTMGREVVPPQLVDIDGHRRPAETFFDAARFEKEFGTRLRESSFLYNKRLNTTNMYPLARLRITMEGWAAVQRIAAEGAEPATVYYAVPVGNSDRPLASLLTALLKAPDIMDAKLVLLRFANGVDPRMGDLHHVREQAQLLQAASGSSQSRLALDSFEGYLCKVRTNPQDANSMDELCQS